MSSAEPNDRYSTSPSYYPTYPKREIHGINPLTINSLPSIEIDDLQHVFSKGISERKNNIKGNFLKRRALLENDHDIMDIKSEINKAKRNQILCRQIEQKQLLKLKSIIQESEEEEFNIKINELDRKKKLEEENKKHLLWLETRRINLEQMEEKKRLKIEADKEYEKDKKNTEEAYNKILLENKLNEEEKERKKLINQSYMEASLKERELIKKRREENDRIEEINLINYLKEKEKRDNLLLEKKKNLQMKKDKILDKINKEKAKEKAEKDYWENLRNELTIERENKKQKIKDLEEKIKRQKLKEDVIQSAINQMKEKEKRKEEEKKLEEQFKQEMLLKYEKEKNEEKLMNEKKKLKEIEFNNEVERLWKIRLEQYQLQREQEIRELEEQKLKEEEIRNIIEEEKSRLVKENEDILKKYNAEGYNKLKNYIKPNAIKTKLEINRPKRDIIYNNIFGNVNPNQSSVYPKYQHIKNYVYDVNIQDIQPNINRNNHLMYNAYLNNNYDTYPTEKEYRENMEKNKEKYIRYAGGNPIRENSCYIKNAPSLIDYKNGIYNRNKINYSLNLNNTVGGDFNYSLNNSNVIPNYNITNTNYNSFDNSLNSGNFTNRNLNSRYQEKIPEMI